MNTIRVPRARQSDLVVQQSKDEMLVYDMKANKAHCLNETMAAIWVACDGSKTIGEIAESIEGISQDIKKEAVWLAIDELNQRNLLDEGLDLNFAGESRREMIKKVGFASAAAIPVIASLAAPTSILAAASCACLDNGDCITGCPSTICNTTSGQCA
ncbi:MAG: PqqD family protein [Acidobacteriota bacterium]|nr:PqqD family protein [Acidobacteriota bacterium]MDH3530602.1 PqqD family protein [Acidobacteriota bacterium]